ncbi:MAG: fatty acid desaturase, partial [Bacteroidota bacterium]
RRNEMIYTFWFRSVVYSYISAWRLESKRLEQQEHSFWSWQNEMLRFTLAQLAYLGLIVFLLPTGGFGWVVLAGIIGFLLLETINYIEHYGLRRRQLDSGRYERVRPMHSWNSNAQMGRIVLYELTRHSDHHFIANKKYQILDHHDEAPELPLGYPASMLIALVPPVWFAVMNRRIPA